MVGNAAIELTTKHQSHEKDQFRFIQIMNLPRVVLLPRRAKPFYARHPWVYPGAIAGIEGEPADGSIVDLVSHTGNFVARGFYNGQSKLRVRLYGWSPEDELDQSF